jgi:hypothetical protein
LNSEKLISFHEAKTVPTTRQLICRLFLVLSWLYCTVVVRHVFYLGADKLGCTEYRYSLIDYFKPVTPLMKN